MKRIFTSTLCLLAILIMQAQDTANKNPEMADMMRSNGRIYVVVAVMVTILAGLILYVVRLDKKISKLEKGFK